MGRVVLACKSDEERKMTTCPVFAPYSLHTDRQAESVRHCVGFRSGITASKEASEVPPRNSSSSLVKYFLVSKNTRYAVQALV